MRNHNSPEYREWRKKVLKRDGGKCQMPNCCRKAREVHHINRWVDAPTLRFEVDNGISLCRNDHYRIRNVESSFALLFMKIVAEKKKQ